MELDRHKLKKEPKGAGFMASSLTVKVKEQSGLLPWVFSKAAVVPEAMIKRPRLGSVSGQ